MPMVGRQAVRRSGVALSMWVRGEMPERGHRVDEGTVAWTVPSDILNRRDTPMLVGVDPYGDTVFNRLQIERQLPREVEYLRAKLSIEAGPMLDEVERLMGVATERVHRYLWFVGD
jgi:hypothetical protein